ncbi:MAG: hypothetical protein BWY70_00648 [Bacteroidetes bacterium ADurb.Bin408]|nr:MAG: hypothetical protein BWY70_00648 [Bacteroidetes bacterium ADurb.Bin408]
MIVFFKIAILFSIYIKGFSKERFIFVKSFPHTLFFSVAVGSVYVFSLNNDAVSVFCKNYYYAFLVVFF